MKRRIVSAWLAAIMIMSVFAVMSLSAGAQYDRAMKYTSSAILDGVNTNGEYDNAPSIYLNYYGKDTNGDRMRVVYTDEAIYVLVEVFDSTVVTYSQGGSSKSDFGFLGFKVGSAFSGVKRFYRGSWRDAMSCGTVNMRDGIEKYANENEYFAIIDNGAAGMAMEARFPVSKLSAAEQTAYKNGTLEVRFTAGTQDGTQIGTSYTVVNDGDIANDGFDGNATEDYFTYSSYKVKNPSVYTKYSFGTKTDPNCIKNVPNVILDGVNTNGEYDDAGAFTIDKVTYGGADPLGDSLRAVYTGDAIYVLVESLDTTLSFYSTTTVGNVTYTGRGGSADFVDLYYRIGSSLIGREQLFRHTLSSTAWTGDAPQTRSSIDSGKLSLEVMFPISSLSAADKAAFYSGTLDIGFDVMIRDTDSNNFVNTYHTSGKEVASFWGGASYASSYTSFYLDKKCAHESYTNGVCDECGSKRVLLELENGSASIGDKVDIGLDIVENVGINHMVLSVKYDTSALKLTSVENGEIMSMTETGSDIVLSSVGDTSASGRLLTFSFDAPDNKGYYLVECEVKECLSSSLENIDAVVYGGVVGVGISSVLRGDANDDDKIDIKDAILISQYLAGYNYNTGESDVSVSSGADVNGDDKIDIKDAILISQYLAEYDYNTGESGVILGPGKMEELCIGGVNALEYTIVYANNDTKARSQANDIRMAIFKATGKFVEVKADGAYTGGKEILVGHSSRTEANGVASSFYTSTKELAQNQMIMYSDGDFLFLGGVQGSTIAMTAAVGRLIEDINKFINGDADELSYDSCDPIMVEGVSIYKIVTYNDGDNVTTKTNRVSELLLELAPDIIGMQEVQKAHAETTYPSLMANYTSIYFDHKEPGVAYGAPILFRKDKFSVVECGTQWLSDTPDVAGSYYSDSAYVRSYVYAILKDKQTGQEIVVVNTHLDYVASANKKQMQKLLELTARFEDRIVIYTGDFNMKNTSSSFALMNGAGYTDGGTAYGEVIPSSHIDFVFVDTDEVTVTDYKYVSDHKYSAGTSQPASDHDPVMIEILISK